MKNLKNIFFFPGDWLAEQTTARTRRTLATWVLILSIVPLTPIWIAFFFSSVPFLAAVSIAALWLAAWGIAAAESPVENEDDVKERREQKQIKSISGKKRRWRKKPNWFQWFGFWSFLL